MTFHGFGRPDFSPAGIEMAGVLRSRETYARMGPCEQWW
jgi:hypothetical protein